MRTRRFCAIISIGLALCVTAAQVGAAITADLDDGNTGVLVDGYRGVPGQGWTDEGKRPTSGGAYTTGPGAFFRHRPAANAAATPAGPPPTTITS